ncbi:MAG: ATP-binding protein [Tannerella sp.]|jgi:anti-sigma regulatory factor (Ser/Thr protein kinase)|nr:ATP-binding protein [Tannerella sp.]
MTMSFQVDGGDFSRAGYASSRIKKMLKQLNVDSSIIRRTVVALYESEVNIVAHAYRGVIEVNIDPAYIHMELKDEGPGIADIEQAMQRGYSTASPQVREMGFGAGMGLANIRDNADEFDLKSDVGKGTTLNIKIYLP